MPSFVCEGPPVDKRSPNLAYRDLLRSRFQRYTGCPKNKPKGLKVSKEDQRLIGLLVDRLDGQLA